MLGYFVIVPEPTATKVDGLTIQSILRIQKMSEAQVIKFPGLIVTNEVSQQVEGKGRVKVGEWSSYIPSLEEFGLAVIPKLKADGTPDLTEDGLYQYEGLAEAFLYRSVVSTCKADARNKLQTKTATLRPGCKMPENFVEVITPSERQASVVFAERRALIAAWSEFVSNLPKSEGVKKLAISFFNQPEGLLAQPENVRNAVLGWVNEFGEALVNAEQLSEWQASFLQKIAEYCEQDPAELDW